MCGLAGILDPGIDPRQKRVTVERMLARIVHRGPDSSGLYFDDRLAIGAARLSIVDVAGGAQPIHDSSGRYWIAFNGQVYNHRELRGRLEAAGHVLHTQCDTEVFLHAWIAWGVNAFQQINGPYAVALYDRNAGTLVLARDRFGKRPLYYVRHGRGWWFASEIKCFLVSDGPALRPDPDRLATIFRTWTPLDDESCFADVDQVPPGAIVCLGPMGDRGIHHPPPVPPKAAPPLTEGEAIERTRAKLEQSVRLRLCSDMEVGVYLSGGLDSAIVADLASRMTTSRLKTFSITFADARYDESAAQAELAGHLGSDHRSLRIDDRAIAATFPTAIWHAEVPVFRNAFVPLLLLSQEVRAQGVKVVLTGEGADEIFLGYDLFKEVLLRSEWPDLDGEQRRYRLASLYPYLRQFDQENQNLLYAYFDRLGSDSGDALFSHEVRYRGTGLAARLLVGTNDGLGRLRRRIERATYDGSAMTTMQRAQLIEMKTLMSGYLLSTQGDRMAMANSVETRCPFLDPDVADWGRVTNLRFDDGWHEKYLLKRAFESRLPRKVIARAKQPYLAPDATAFVRSRPDYLDLVLSASELGKVAGLNVGFCQRLTAKVLRSQSDVGQAESHAFMLLLSTAMVRHQFASGVMPPALSSPPGRTFDGRGSVVASH